MKVLFVHEVSWFTKVVYEMHDFPELLSLRGHEVRFLDYDEQAVRTTVRVVESDESRAHVGSRVTVTTPPRVFPGIVGRLLATIIHPLVFIRMVRSTRPDVVVLYSIPTSGWQIMWLCGKWRIPAVVRVIDIPYLLRRTRFKRLVKWSENYVFRHASFVSTHNEALRHYCLNHGAPADRTGVLIPGVDTRRFQPSEPSVDLSRSLALNESDKVILFMGTLFPFSGVGELIRELAPAMIDDRRLKFLVLGDGEELPRIADLVSSLGLGDQVRLTGRIEYAHLADYLHLGEVAVLPFHPELVAHGALPGKVLQYLACGLPTVSSRLRGLQSVVPEGDGVLYTDSLKEMAEVALTLLSAPRRCTEIRNRGLRFVNRECNWPVQVRRFEQMLTDVTRK